MFLTGVAVSLFWAAIYALMRWGRRKLNGRADFWFQPLSQVFSRLLRR